MGGQDGERPETTDLNQVSKRGLRSAVATVTSVACGMWRVCGQVGEGDGQVDAWAVADRGNAAVA